MTQYVITVWAENSISHQHDKWFTGTFETPLGMDYVELGRCVHRDHIFWSTLSREVKQGNWITQPHLFIAHAKCWLIRSLYAPLSKEPVFTSPLRKDNTGGLPFRQKPVCAFTYTRAQGKKQNVDYTAAGLLEVYWSQREGNKLSIQHENECSLLHSKADLSSLFTLILLL